MARFDSSASWLRQYAGKRRAQNCHSIRDRIHLRVYSECLGQVQSACTNEAEPQQRPEILSTRSNEILTAVVQGARKEETNSDVNLAAMRALYNSLEFVRENFEREVRK